MKAEQLRENFEKLNKLKSNLEALRDLISLVSKREKIKKKIASNTRNKFENIFVPNIMNFREVLNIIKREAPHYFFNFPTDSREMVKYLNLVQYPVSFKMILNNLNKYKYSSREDFMREIFTMINNTNQYFDGNKTISNSKECDRIKSLVLEYDKQHSNDKNMA